MLTLLDSTSGTEFPHPSLAEEQPNGLLAIGGDLSLNRLLRAYRSGIFPWFNAGQPILWWSPDPRMILRPDWLNVSRSLRKTLRRDTFEVSTDTVFGDVIDACAAPRDYSDDTWILPEMNAAYRELHAAGYAHSVETWQDGTLVGGLYGVQIGGVFFGESMFSRATDASKVALLRLTELLVAAGVDLIDCQIHNEHLQRLGAREIRRERFLGELARHTPRHCPVRWDLPRVSTRAFSVAS